jgi:anti-sigma factor RsiW
MTGDCRTVEPLLSAWLDDALRPWERVGVAVHLEACDRCSTDLEQLRRVRSLTRSLPVRLAGEGLLAHSAHRAAHPPPPPPPRPAALVLRRIGATTAIVVGLVAGAAYSLGGAPDGERPVRLPLDLYVADHLVHAVNGPITTPVFTHAGRSVTASAAVSGTEVDR